MARATAVKMPPEASAAHGCEGARRVLALMLAFSADRNTLTARELAAATGIALPSVYRYITLLRETGLLAGLPSEQRKSHLAALAERDPEAAAELERKALEAARQGYAISEEELEQGVWAVSAPVFQGKRMIAVLTVPSPLVRAPAPLQEKLLSQVRAAAQDLNEALRVTRR